MNATAATLALESNGDVDVADYVNFAKFCVGKFIAKAPHAARHRDDLTSEAMLALVICGKKFDSTRGVAFSRYASIRIASRLSVRLRSISRHEANHTGGEPVDREVIVSVDNSSAPQIAAALLDCLPPAEREVIEGHYIAGRSITDQAEWSGVPRKTVERLVRHGLAMMRREAAAGGTQS